MVNLEGKRIDPKKLGPRWKLCDGDYPGTKQVRGTILTERYLSAAELLQAGVFAFGGPPLQVLLRVTIDLDLELAITYINVEACGGSADMVGPPVDCDTTEEDEELVERVIGGFLF